MEKSKRITRGSSNLDLSNIPNIKFKIFIIFLKDSPARLLKYIELLTLKEKSSTEAATDRKSLNTVAIVINTKCNLKCVWCIEKKKYIKDSGYLERNGNLEKLKNSSKTRGI